MSQIDGFVIAAEPAAHFGPGAVGELPAIVRAAGADQVVVVTDAALATAPVIEKVLAVLAEAGLPARLFAGVHPTPTPGDLAAGAGTVAGAAADAATASAAASAASAASASAAAVAAMLTPSAPLVAPHPSTLSGSTLSGSTLYRPPPPAGPSYLSGPQAVLQPAAPLPLASALLAGPRIALVAVGSGAPVDAAKGIAIAAASDFAGPALPIVAVPVPAGTGAETSALGLIADPADGRTFYVGHAGTMPAAAILDPELAADVPPAVIAGCGLDALTRALESYLALRPNPWSDGIALQAIRMVAASLPRAVMDGTDLAARSQLLLAAHMAGVATASTGLGLCHAIGRSLGTRWDIARGAALAMLLPEVLRFDLPARLERMADVAFALGVGDTHADTWLNAEAAIGAVTALRDDVGLNRLMSDFGITEADFAQICADALADEVLASTPRPAAADDIRAILLAVAGQPR
ncbi:MAG: iron-containing alcohol dehydrogenase [Streptosporangiaceae bacterium]|jgi:alcohol dehydrogenase